MKKIICFLITVVLVFSSTSFALADQKHKEEHNRNQCTNENQDYNENHDHDKGQKLKSYNQNKNIKSKKQSFKINGSPVIKYNRFKLPISPVTKGMGATVNYNKTTAVLTVEKGTVKIVIDFKNETVTVNGVVDIKSGIFKAKNDKKMTVLIQYIADILGARVKCGKDKIEIEVPGLDYPTNVTVTPIGTVVKPNTLNSTSVALTASAKIKAGQATGGRAELYVGSRLVAVDTFIAAGDTTVTFTTSDGTPTNEELRAIVPEGGAVTVKLYNAANQSVTSKSANPTLVVDYVAPTIASITSAAYNPADGKLILNVTGASAAGDKVDVTKLAVIDTALGRTYRLTASSSGKVKDANTLEIILSSADRSGLAGFGGTTAYISADAGPLLYDDAGNVSVNFTVIQTAPLTVTSLLEAPSNITLTPVGAIVKPNTLNTTTLYLNASATIKAGQATGGRAELYVGARLVAVDPVINAADTTVTFTTDDGTPTNAELMALIPVGGAVTVKLYNANGQSLTSAQGPTLTVDYAAPTIAGITSAIYNISGGNIYLNVAGAGAAGDKVDVTRISIYDTALNRTYQLTNAAQTGSSGIVVNDSTIAITLGSTDKYGLSGFGQTTNFLNVAAGAFLSDLAGNVSGNFTSNLSVPLTVLK